MTGLDLNSRAVDFCRRHYAVPGLRFRAGSSESLPFADAGFDVVINVESSHCYGSMNRFLCEVRRVLRPGGRFLFTDFRPAGAMPGLRRDFDLAGFDVESETAITPNVFRALELDEERRLDLIRRRVPSLLRAAFRQFAATSGTPTWDAFRTGRWEYASFVLAPRPADD
jgi:SAM-dependent methyltransferase